MARRRVAVLMGGMSSEHEVSLSSGRQVVESLDRGKYEVTPVTVSKTGLWEFPDRAPVSIFDAIGELRRREFACVFLALHGPFGEDGRIQGMLDLLGIPYTFSGCAASAIAMDKIRCKSVVREAGLRVAPHATVDRDDWSRGPEAVVRQISAALGYPCVVKPACQGSSVGMAIPQDASALRAAIPAALESDRCAMIEKFIRGTEVTCGVLDVGADGAQALPVTEIRPLTSSFFDYHAKYTPGASAEITPAAIPADVAAEVQDMAVRAHRAVGCSTWSRNDFIIGPDGPVWIEINTIPGLTPTSLYPQAAAAAGISFSQLVDLFVESAIAGRR